MSQCIQKLHINKNIVHWKAIINITHKNNLSFDNYNY